ncbi:endospore germination permease [Paenibacillus terreus]|uniref:Endospore germination permease n=1 Tax=Paenibacillus terreus TaxID=1387834 RepID=A0ABV5B7S4_9BACL
MLENGRINTRQLTILVLLTLVGDMALVYPEIMCYIAKQDAWIAAVVSIPLGTALIWLLLKLYCLHPGLTLIESVQTILGKWAGGAVALFYLQYFIIAGCIYIREIEDFTGTQIYERTPGSVIRFMVLFLVVCGVYLGLEVIGRSAEVFLPMFIFFLVGLLVLLLPQAHWDRLLPMMDTPVPTLLEAVKFGVFYPFGEVLIILMIYPYARVQKHTNRDILFGVILGALGLNLIVLLSATVLGVYLTEQHFFAAYVLAQKINIGEFLQRIEALMGFAWFISTYFKTLLYFYGFTLGTAQLFRLHSRRLLILPTGLLAFGLVELLSPDMIFYIKTIPPFWVSWNITLSLVIPLLLLGVNALKQSGKRNKQPQTQQ